MLDKPTEPTALIVEEQPLNPHKIRKERKKSVQVNHTTVVAYVGVQYTLQAYVPYILQKIASIDSSPCVDIAIVNHKSKEEDGFIITVRIWETKNGVYDSSIIISSKGEQFYYQVSNTPMWNTCGNNMNIYRASYNLKQGMLQSNVYTPANTIEELNQAIDLAFSMKGQPVVKVETETYPQGPVKALGGEYDRKV